MKLTLEDILNDLTGEQLDDIETTLGCPIEDAPSYKLTKSLGYVRAKQHENQPDLKYRDYNKRTFREIKHDCGLDEEDTDPKGDEGN